MPAQRMQMKTPVLMDAQDGREPAPPPVQSAQALFSGRNRSCFRKSTCFLFSSSVTPFISPAFFPLRKTTSTNSLHSSEGRKEQLNGPGHHTKVGSTSDINGEIPLP
jgi:hypothetical protein